MTERKLTSLQEAADHLLDTLASGELVTLDITAQDAATGALLRLITEIHAVAQARRLGITMVPMEEGGLRLTLTEP